MTSVAKRLDNQIRREAAEIASRRRREQMQGYKAATSRFGGFEELPNGGGSGAIIASIEILGDPLPPTADTSEEYTPHLFVEVHSPPSPGNQLEVPHKIMLTIGNGRGSNHYQALRIPLPSKSSMTVVQGVDYPQICEKYTWRSDTAKEFEISPVRKKEDKEDEAADRLFGPDAYRTARRSGSITG